MKKLVRVTTVPISLKILLKGQHRFMSYNGFEVVGVSSSGDELNDVAKDENIRVEVLEMKRQVSPFNDFVSLIKMIFLLKKEKPNIVHTHTPKAGMLGMIASKIVGIPIRMHTVAGLPLMETIGFKRKILNIVEKITYSCATNVYPNSKGLYNFIIENRFTTTDKLKVIGKGSSNGINTDVFSLRHYSSESKDNLRGKLGVTKDDFVFIFVGRLVRDKGINELVEAFSNLKSQNLKLLLVGSFEQELDPLLPETIKEIEQNKNIIAVGFQKDVRPYFAISNALVFPSYREGFPNVVMQAGAMELPSIVSNINGSNEIIVEGENGIIISVKNSEEITDAMNKIINNKKYYDYLKANSRRMIQTRYEQSIVWNALLEEYHLLITNQKLSTK